MSSQLPSTSLAAYTRLVVYRAFKDFRLGRDMLLGTAITLAGLLLQVFFHLISVADWRAHKWLWIISLVSPYFVILILHVIWRLTTAQWRVHQDREAATKSLRAGHERETPKIQGAAEWKDMSDRFRKAEQHARADWHRLSDGSESWDIRLDFTGECRSLCNLAGTMLAKSSNIFSQLSDKIRLQGDPVTRWLDFLIESKTGRLEGMIHGVGTDEDGKQIGMPHLSGFLNDVCSVSAVASISCAAKETEGKVRPQP